MLGIAHERHTIGGCGGLVDPLLDARVTHPIWQAGDHPAVHLHPLDESKLKFSLWKVPGRKALWQDGQRLVLDVSLNRRAARLVIASSLHDGAPFGYSIPAGFDPAEYASPLASAVAIIQAPAAVSGASRSRATRTELLHMRALQVLDALQAGASQREIALALFGSERVVRHWEPDGDLRAQVRYLIRRGREYVRGGYRTLLQVGPGDRRKRLTAISP